MAKYKNTLYSLDNEKQDFRLRPIPNETPNKIYIHPQKAHRAWKKWKIGNDVLLLLSHNYHGNILNYEYNNEINTNPGVNQEEFTYL